MTQIIINPEYSIRIGETEKVGDVVVNSDSMNLYSLASVMEQIIDDNVSPHNPIISYNAETGIFKITSSLINQDFNEIYINYDGFYNFFISNIEHLSKNEILSGVENIDKDWIFEELIINNID